MGFEKKSHFFGLRTLSNGSARQ